MMELINDLTLLNSLLKLMNKYLNFQFAYILYRGLQFVVYYSSARMFSQSQAYIKTIIDLRGQEEKKLDFIFKQLSSLFSQNKFEKAKLDILDKLLEQYLLKSDSRSNGKAKTCLVKYRKQLSQLYLLLQQDWHDSKLDLDNLPAIVEKSLAQYGKRLKKQENIAFLQIVCSIFIPYLITIIKYTHVKIQQMYLTNAESLCFGLNFTHLHSIYLDQKLFLQEILSKPLRIINNIPTLNKYSFYYNVPLTDAVDINHCILSSPLIDQSVLSHKQGNEIKIELFNCSKLIKFNKIIKQRPLTNNSLLNVIQRLQISTILSIPVNKQLPKCKTFCLTFPISQKHYLKLRLFFEKIPPEIAPFSRHDVFSYAKEQENKTIFYRFGTEGYWEHCPSSQLSEIYYLCNQSQIEWMSISSQQYYKTNRKIKFWSNQQLQYFYNSKVNMFRGIQKKGDFVIIGAGHEHFWRVKQYKGIAVLLKWSMLLKQYTSLAKYINIIRSRERNVLMNSSNMLNYPHRRIILQYLSHEHQNLDSHIISKLVNFFRSAVNKQYNSFSKLCISYQNQSTIRQKSLPSKYRLCGICGKQILNLFASFKENIVCLGCLQQEISFEDCSLKFELNYMAKPIDLQNYLKNLALPNEIQDPNVIGLYESTFCQGSFLGNYQIDNCSGQPIHIQDPLTNHISKRIDNFVLYIFQDRSYFISIESAIKSYALKIRKSEQQQRQISLVLRFMIDKCVGQQQRKAICSQIYHHYNEKNYVLMALNLLNHKQKT